MPRKHGNVTAYSLHMASGKAVVRIDGRDHYLGPCGSPEGHEKYGRRIAEWRRHHQDRSKNSTGICSQRSEVGGQRSEVRDRRSDL